MYYFYMHVSADYMACKWMYPPFVTLILNKKSDIYNYLVLNCLFLRITIKSVGAGEWMSVPQPMKQYT